jgi:hypothetical protein
MMCQFFHLAVSWSSGYDFPLTIALGKCSGKVLGSIPRETIFLVFFSPCLFYLFYFLGFQIAEYFNAWFSFLVWL